MSIPGPVPEKSPVRMAEADHPFMAGGGLARGHLGSAAH
jgi:hypothetical protein